MVPVTPPSSAEFAILGAGVAGLACASQLHAAGRSVQLFDKGRRPGGRVATRRLEGGLEFDHGAQYFTARHPEFQHWLKPRLAAGLVAEWSGRLVSLSRGVITPEPSPTTRYVGVPGMSALAAALAGGLPIHLADRVTRVERREGQWWLLAEEAGLCGPYRHLVCALPAPQGIDLLQEHPVEFLPEMQAVTLAPCWALMLHLARPLPVDYAGAFVADSPLRWIASNSSKPGRPAPECWVLHAGPEWSQATFDEPPATIDSWLRDALWEAVGCAPQDVLASSSQRWKYAIPPSPLSERFLADETLHVSVCGDWCGGPRVEGAFLSGWELGRQLVSR